MMYNWKSPVELLPIHFNDRETKLPVTIPQKAVLVGGKYMASVSDDYKLITNDDAITSILCLLTDMNIKYTVPRIDFNGKRMHALIVLPDQKIVMKNGDSVEPLIHLFNSYDTTLAFSIAIAANRHICTNYLYIGNPIIVQTIHNKNRETISSEDVSALLSQNILTFKMEEGKWKDFDEADFSESHFNDFQETVPDIPQMYKTKVTELIKSLLTRNERVSAWRILNCYSYIMTSPKSLLSKQTPTTVFGKQVQPGIEKGRDYIKYITSKMEKMILRTKQSSTN